MFQVRGDHLLSWLSLRVGRVLERKKMEAQLIVAFFKMKDRLEVTWNQKLKRPTDKEIVVDGEPYFAGVELHHRGAAQLILLLWGAFCNHSRYRHSRQNWYHANSEDRHSVGSCQKRQKPQALTPQAPIRNRQTRKVANAKALNRNTNLT